MAAGVSCVAFATAEMQEALGYGNWLKDIINNDTVYGAMFIVSNIAAVAVNMVGVKQCFKEGTLVACLDEDGNETQLPIEKIAVGTLVLAYDEATGEKEYKPVVQLFRNTTKQWCTVCVEVDGKKENIISTLGHKYYLPFNAENREIGLKQEHESYYELSEKWVSAYKLKVGDKVLISDGKYGIIKSVKLENLSTSENTYNLEVADFHTYYVGANPVCVHNSNCGFGKYKDKMEMSPNEALDAATDFLGEDYIDVSQNTLSRFVSKDGMRQVRMSFGDLTGSHGPGPHINFDILKPTYKSIHIILKG